VQGSLQKLADIIIVNSMPVTLLSARLLERMVERNHGIIVNISSAAAFMPLCYFGVYSAVKVSTCGIWGRNFLRLKIY
jgi:short-subunit dehydrogenase